MSTVITFKGKNIEDLTKGELINALRDAAHENRRLLDEQVSPVFYFSEEPHALDVIKSPITYFFWRIFG